MPKITDQNLKISNILNELDKLALLSKMSFMINPDQSLAIPQSIPEPEYYQVKINDTHYRMNLIDVDNRILIKFADITSVKSSMISLLVANKNVKQAVSELTDLVHYFTKIDHSNELTAKVIQTPSEKFTLVNLIMTNTELPQVFYLGRDLFYEYAESFYDYFGENVLYYEKNETPRQIIKAFAKCYYPYHIDHALSYCKDQIVDLGTSSDQLSSLESLYQLEIEQVIKDNEKTVMDDLDQPFGNLYSSAMIVYDINWFLDFCRAEVAGDRFQELPLDREHLTEDSSAVVDYLANNLRN